MADKVEAFFMTTHHTTVQEARERGGHDLGYIGMEFYTHGLRCALNAWYFDASCYGVSLHVNGVQGQGFVTDIDTVDAHVFGNEILDSGPILLHEWSNVEPTVEAVDGLVHELIDQPYVLEGLVLLHAGHFIDRLERYEASLREVA